MIRRCVAIALAGVLVLGSLTQRARKAHAATAELLEGGDRYVDMGVVLRVVTRDPECGRELLSGKPPLVVLREHPRGGILDTTSMEFVGRSVRPVYWYCSPELEPLVLHGPDAPLRICVEGAMGVGKTTAMAQWLGLRALEALGLDAEIGVTAPTVKRLGEVKRALFEMLPRPWWTWKERDAVLTLVTGVTLRLVSTHQQSEAEGSPIQGYSWIACASDELQDSLNVDGDIEARGRDAPRGQYKRFATCTVKDAPDYRTWKDRVRTTSVWGFYKRKGTDSPFTFPEYWDQLRETMAPREYQRKVLAEDVGPERMTYPTWSRRENLRPVPRIGCEDVTRAVLAPYGEFAALVGHDPGALTSASVVLKAFRLRGETRHSWWVVDEITTTESTTDDHALALLACLRKEEHGLRRSDLRGRLLPPQALVRADPFSESATEYKPDKSVYTVLANHGLDVRPAAYSKVRPNARTVGSIGPGVVPKDAGIEMVVRLLCDAAGHRRLYIACDDRGQPCAPRLVAALEQSERDEGGRAEWERKGKGDRHSHHPSALRYALWDLERPIYAEAVS